jgi:aspartyl-tRNA(Asn)/glutamyl-tRNA(Gln) amidotransferase subunit A
MYLADMFTNPANLAGIPALSLPWGADDAGLPIGMQLLGPRFAEERILGAAEALGRR